VPPRTFRGRSMTTLMAQVRAELGDDAVIHGVQSVRGPDGATLVEITCEAAGGADAPALPRPPRAAPAPAPTVALPAAERDVAAAASPSPSRLRPWARQGLGGPDVLAFVGPTGAGKTTTVAKLAAHPRLFPQYSVGLLCLDTYRVGAVEQLAAYAGLARRPLEVAYDAADLRGALDRLGGLDVILVDCPGRGPRAERDLAAVRDLLRRLAPTEVHVVLPAGLREDLARRALGTYRQMGASHLLVTKTDEYPDDWGHFELAVEAGLPMRWIGDGQAVPQDLRSAAPRLDAARASARGRAGRRVEAVA